MGALTIVEIFVTLFIGLGYWFLVVVQSYDAILAGLLHSTLVVGQLDYTMLWGLSIAVFSLIFFLIIGIVIGTFNRITYLTGWN